MAGDTVKTDIIISIHPKHVANIASRLKDHEFRNYLLPSSVQRMWIYETSPTQAIKYVARISHGKRPGEITNTQGLNNVAFNEAKLEDSKFAYEILELHATPAPWTLQDLKAKGWLNGPPQKYCYFKKSMVDALKGIELVKIFGTTSQPPAEMGDTGNSEQATCAAVEGEKPSKEPAPTSRVVASSKSKPTGIVKKSGKTINVRAQKGPLLTKWLEG